MTTPTTARYLALIAASNARIEGMKAYNALCLARGIEPLYPQNDFLHEATGLEQIAQELLG